MQRDELGGGEAPPKALDASQALVALALEILEERFLLRKLGEQRPLRRVYHLRAAPRE